MRAALVVVGNELLSGHTKDANGPFLIGALRERGHRVQRLTIVRDVEDEIRHALAEAAKIADLLFVCGGLGPTLDDITIDAVASFLERPLETPKAAREQIERIYRLGKERGVLASDTVDVDAWRMARIPAGGIVVRNSTGVAPGSVHTFERAGGTRTLYVLPGPPRELQSVFAHLDEMGLLPDGQVEEVAEVHFATFEAPVAKALREVDQISPDVELGSYPQHGEMRVIVRVTGAAKPVADAVAALRKRLGHIELEPGSRSPDET